MTTAIHHIRQLLAGRARRSASTAVAAAAATAAAGAAATERVSSSVITGDAGHAAAAGGARSARAVERSRRPRRPPRRSAQVLWDDLELRARVLHDSARHLQVAFPPRRRSTTVPFDRWRELGADGAGRSARCSDAATGIRVELRLYNVRARQSVFGREYTGSAANPRLYAHTMSDEMHESQRKLRGVARTKLTFSSDRNGEPVVGDRRKARRQGDLHRRLRRREPAAHHDQPDVEHHAELVARRPLDRLHLVSHAACPTS